MKYLTLFGFLLGIMGCGEANLSNRNAVLQRGRASTKVQLRIYPFDTLDVEGALVNNHKIVLLQKEFEKAYGTPDSANTRLWECGNPFGYLDDVWMTKAYGAFNNSKNEYENFDGSLTTLFVHRASFSTNGHIVLFNQADAVANNFTLVASGITLNENTTVETFEKAFPKLAREPLEEAGDYRYRILLGKGSEDAFLFYFKEGKLDCFLLWWWLC